MNQLTREEAIADCKTLWKDLATLGGKKNTTILQLYEMRLIKQPFYQNDCPLCEVFIFDHCEACPWPEVDNQRSYTRCCSWDGPYHNWRQNPTRENASAVYKHIKDMK